MDAECEGNCRLLLFSSSASLIYYWSLSIGHPTLLSRTLANASKWLTPTEVSLGAKSLALRTTYKCFNGRRTQTHVHRQTHLDRQDEREGCCFLRYSTRRSILEDISSSDALSSYSRRYLLLSLFLSLSPYVCRRVL